MENHELQKILKKLESKKTDCINFSKKYESRNMEELKQYYDGANWAIEYTIALLTGKIFPVEHSE
jgi:hypothetical protein